MKQLFLPTYFLFILLFSCQVTYADPEDPFFIQHYDNSNGLSNSAINHLFKDADNILWVATWDGLNMYDGSSFHVFNYSKENDFKSIGSNVIQNITEDKKGNIWITTIGGISRFEKKTGKFYNYFYNPAQQGKVSEQEYALAIDTGGKVYCLNQRKGLSCYDIVTDSFRSRNLPQAGSQVSKFAFDESNQLWLLNANGQLDVYTSTSNGFKLSYTCQQKKGIVNFFVVNHEVFFCTGDDKLFEINSGSLTPRLVLQMDHAASAIGFYKDHYLLAWATKGYAVFDNNFKPSSFLSIQTKQLQNIKITSWARGSEDILWYGTDGNGIIKVYPKTKSFGTVTTSENGTPYNRSVRTFCEENGNLWIGTKGSGIIVYQNFWEAANIATDKQSFSSPAQLDNNAVYVLKKGNDGLLYIGSDGKGLGVYDIVKKQFKKWADIIGNGEGAAFGSVYAILPDTDSSLWLGTSGFGLIHLKINRDRAGNLSMAFIEKFTFNNSDTGPANDIIYALTAGDAEHIWVGCRYGGLSLMNKKTKRFETFKAFTYEGSLSNNDVLSIYKDSRNRIWVGTSYGLNWISEEASAKKNPVFQKLTTANGLPNNTIHAIEEDRMGNIWVSSNRGLAMVNQADLSISYYQQSDGLQSNEFCDGAVWKDKLDNLFFGGTSGFNKFLPQNIRKSALLPHLLLSGISAGGVAAMGNGFTVMNAGNNQPLDFFISRKNNFFELDVKAISFLNSDKCEYAYFLQGYDNAWHYAGTAGKIIYNNISPGNYRLKIKWSNGEGTWTNEKLIMTLEVKQYFWLMWYAYLVYVLSLLAVIYVLYKYRKNKLEIKHQLELEHMMRTKEEEVHQDRLGFFTNIAHELQTPLTLILGSSELFLEKTVLNRPGMQKPYFLSLIHQQASRLTYLVQQLMEFRKGEAGFFKYQFSYLNITELLNNLAEPFVTLSEQYTKLYELRIQPNLHGWVDKDKVEKIIFNLLSNAFKHSGKNDQIIFSAAENLQTKELEITVSNSGVQLPDDQLEHLFDKFYVAQQKNAEADKFGTGIGLAFTKQLVTMLKGTIIASSENGWVIFKVQLPLTVPVQEDMLQHSGTDEPSYLYRTITTYNEMAHPVSPVENNKDAILENLLDADKKIVLIVEDEPGIRFLLRDILKDDYIIYEAEDGEKALELMPRFLPDIIVCDVMMPKMNGLELCNHVKNAVATCHIPFILLSARNSEEQHMEGYEVGADAYIAKPFHAAHLKLRVQKLLEYRRKLLDLVKSDVTTDLINEPDIPASDKEFLTTLVKLIEENLAVSELNAELLEKELCMSKMQLYRKLKTLTGMTPGEFIKHTRLKEAARLLITTKYNVSEIFFRTGFNNQSYFFREFKKRYECAPTDYRDKFIQRLG